MKSLTLKVQDTAVKKQSQESLGNLSRIGAHSRAFQIPENLEVEYTSEGIKVAGHLYTKILFHGEDALLDSDKFVLLKIPYKTIRTPMKNSGYVIADLRGEYELKS